MDVQTLLASLIRNSIWLKILGIFLIVYGVIFCVTIIGLLFGWLPIWLGVLLFSSANRLDAVKEYDDPEDAVECIEKISRFFKISAIVTLVYIGFFVLVGAYAFIASFLGVTGFN